MHRVCSILTFSVTEPADFDLASQKITYANDQKYTAHGVGVFSKITDVYGYRVLVRRLNHRFFLQLCGTESGPY